MGRIREPRTIRAIPFAVTLENGDTAADLVNLTGYRQSRASSLELFEGIFTVHSLGGEAMGGGGGDYFAHPDLPGAFQFNLRRGRFGASTFAVGSQDFVCGPIWLPHNAVAQPMSEWIEGGQTIYVQTQNTDPGSVKSYVIHVTLFGQEAQA